MPGTSGFQYQNQLRLQEAKRLMLTGSMGVTTAALEVGYESPSQFIREYKRSLVCHLLRILKKFKTILYHINEIEQLY